MNEFLFVRHALTLLPVYLQVLVIGFEQMSPRSIKSVWSDRPSPMGLSTRMMEDTRGKHDSPRYAQYFANAGREYMEKLVIQ